MAGDGFRVTVRNDREVARAFDRLPRQANRELKDGSERLARRMANGIRAAGRGFSRQAAAAARTVRVARGRTPTVVAGPEIRLMGSEFGARRRFGWFAHPRYRGGFGQFPARQAGNPGRWFWPTYRAYQPEIRVAHQEMAAAIVRDFGA